MLTMRVRGAIHRFFPVPNFLANYILVTGVGLLPTCKFGVSFELRLTPSSLYSLTLITIVRRAALASVMILACGVTMCLDWVNEACVPSGPCTFTLQWLLRFMGLLYLNSRVNDACGSYPGQNPLQLRNAYCLCPDVLAIMAMLHDVALF